MGLVERIHTHCKKQPKQGKKVTNKPKKEDFFLRKKVFIFKIKDFKLKKKDFRSNKLVFFFEKKVNKPNKLVSFLKKWTLNSEKRSFLPKKDL